MNDTTVSGYVKSYIAGILGMLKQPKNIIASVLSTGIMIVLQFYLSMRAAYGEMDGVWAILGAIFFANGGMYGGKLAAIGGAFGKMILGIFINALVIGLLNHANPVGDLFGGIPKLFSAFAFKRIGDASALLFGFSTALLIYSFCNQTQDRANSVIGIYLLMMALQSLGKKNSFLYGLLLRVFFGKEMNTIQGKQTVTSLMGGTGFGYTAGTLLTAIQIPIGAYVALQALRLGMLILIIALVVSLVQKPGKA